MPLTPAFYSESNYRDEDTSMFPLHIHTTGAIYAKVCRNVTQCYFQIYGHNGDILNNLKYHIITIISPTKKCKKKTPQILHINLPISFIP